MFYILYGQDDFSIRQSLEGIEQKLGSPEMLAVNTTVLNGRQLSLDQLKAVCGTASFLCPSRLVIVNGLLKRFELGASAGRRSRRSQSPPNTELAEWQALSTYVNEMAPTTVLVLVDGKIGGHNPLLKALYPAAKVMVFPRLQGKRLGDWIQKTVSKRGGTISPEAIDLLLELIGGDLWTMNCEIDKLLAYSSGRLITEGDVKQLTSYAREISIFALVDAILEGQLKIAQRLLHYLLQEGMAPSYILAMITRQLRLIVRIKEPGESSSDTKLQDRLGLTSAYVFDRTMKQAKMYTLERVKQAYHKLLEADIAIKTGKYDAELALDLLVIELCQG